MDNYTQCRMLEKARSYRKLAGRYENWQFNKTMKESLLESAKALEQMAGQANIFTDNLDKISGKIKRRLSSFGIKTEDVFFTYFSENQVELVLHARIKNGCIKAEKIAELVSEVLERRVEVQNGCRSIVTNAWSVYVFSLANNFYVLHGNAIASKVKGDISGDTFTFFENNEGRFIVALCDGMGTGVSAARDSERVMDFLEDYFETGFSENTVPLIINEAMVNMKKETPVTIDMGVIDLKTGMLKMIKAGGAPTFVKRGDQVKIILPSSLPLGVIEETEAYVAEECLYEGDYVIMVSDGVLDCLPFYDKEKQLGEIIKNAKENNPERLAEHIMSECRFFNEKENKDDMTILVTGIWRK